MKKIIVTGGAGFIGSHLVDKFIKKNYAVAVIDDLSGGSKQNCHPKAEFYQCDIRNFKKLDAIFSQVKPHTVYHLAANAAENKAQFSPVDITSRNFDGSIKTLTAAIRNGMKRFIFTSSIAVYGQQQTPFKETAVPEPEDLYGISKLSFEKTLSIMSTVHNFEYVITRPHNVYGPRQNMQDPYRNVVTIFMNAVLNNTPYYIYGDGSMRRCFSYVDDVIFALLKCDNKKFNKMTFNIGSDNDYSIKELSETIQRISKTTFEPIYLPQRPGEVTVAISDHTLSKKYLRYTDKTSLEKGIKKTWKWAKGQGYHKPLYGNIEIDSPLLPKNWRQ